MKIIRSREHLVNLGGYENVKVGASVELGEDDIADLKKSGTTVDDAANEILDDLLSRDLKEALANVPKGSETHLETWQR